MRAVLDPGVVISALLSRDGSPARLVRTWLDGGFDLVVSAKLLSELERALGYPKLRARVPAPEAAAVVGLLRRAADVVPDPLGSPTVRCTDPGDDYLIALAEAARAVVVSGDRALLTLGHEIPVYAPADFLAMIHDT